MAETTRTPDEVLMFEAQEASRGIDCPVPLAHPLRESGAYAADILFRGSPNHRGGFNAGVAWAISRMFDHFTDDQKAAFRAEMEASRAG